MAVTIFGQSPNSVRAGAPAPEMAKEKRDHNKDVFDIFDRLKENEQKPQI